MFNFLVYNKFKFRKWEKLSPQQRLEVFQKLEVIQAKKLGRPVAYVEPKEMDAYSKGFFSSQQNTIYLNKQYFFEDYLRFDGMFTLFHEGRHAYQHHVVFQTQNAGIFSKARKWKKNFEGYIKGNMDEYSFYSMQPIERDANRYALKRLKQFSFRFRYDSMFARTVEYEEMCLDGDKLKARKDLGFFYKQKIAKKQEQNRKNFG